MEFPCAGETLVGTLDDAGGSTGVLIVSGGNECRIGAHRGMARLAAQLAGAGVPVFRFDRRGVGDSTGVNRGYYSSADDIAAAARAFRAAAPHVTTLLGFGNCDAATALALFHRGAGIDRLVLANPWLADEDDALPPAAAIRARYAERLRDPRQWLRLISGKVDIAKLFRGLRKTLAAQPEPPASLAPQLATGIRSSEATVLLARGDATAIAFAAALPLVKTQILDTASHSFARDGDQDWLFDRIVEALSPDLHR
jgi:exosortase A-associated hydrolase 1